MKNWKKWAKQALEFLIFPAVLMLGFLVYRWIFGEASVDDQGNYTFTSNATRELRANNPLGVSMSSTFDWEGLDLTKSVPGPDGISHPGVDNKLGDMLAIFQDTQKGLNAGAWLLFTNYFAGGTPTIGQIGDKWAGGTPTPPNAYSDYSNSLAKILGKSPAAIVSYATDARPVMKGLARMENGTFQVAQIPDQMYVQAVAYGQS